MFIANPLPGEATVREVGAFKHSVTMEGVGCCAFTSYSGAYYNRAMFDLLNADGSGALNNRMNGSTFQKDMPLSQQLLARAGVPLTLAASESFVNNDDHSTLRSLTAGCFFTPGGECCVVYDSVQPSCPHFHVPCRWAAQPCTQACLLCTHTQHRQQPWLPHRRELTVRKILWAFLLTTSLLRGTRMPA